MNNHYHLLVETKNENLSLIARQINSKYAQYFNREYKRVGPLWQGRFKNYFVYDENYLHILLRYIERNPIKAKMTQNIGEYRWSASTFLLFGSHSNLLKDSILIDKELFELLDIAISEEEWGKLATLQKTKYTQENKTIKREKQRTLLEYFDVISSLKQRDTNINEYFECSCHSPEHLLTFRFWEDKYGSEVSAYVFLRPEPFHKRIWAGIKYIFGYTCKYGYFDEFILDRKDVDRMMDLLNKYKESDK
jgi:hypothetical protein